LDEELNKKNSEYLYNYSKNLLDEILFLINNTNGGISYAECMDLPIHIRKYFINRLLDDKKKLEEMSNERKKVKGRR